MELIFFSVFLSPFVFFSRLYYIIKKTKMAVCYGIQQY
jgi:hypothetical protein